MAESDSPSVAPASPARSARTVLDMTGYQWAVLAAAWLGWGFDSFDALLFNWVAPNCVPTLLGLPIGSPEAKAATLQWTGVLTSLLLLGWAAGGILFGKLADRIGRTRTLLLTMLLYSLGTGLCALAPNLWVLVVCRAIASLGIGGEWAAGAAMVAEVMPEKRRIEAGALLYTAAPLGIFLAGFVNFHIAGVWMKGSPETSWRYVFLAGTLPAAVAVLVRVFVREPEAWKRVASHAAAPRLRELFGKQYWRLTRSGLAMAFVALIMWWSCNAFLPVKTAYLAQSAAQAQGLSKEATQALTEAWKNTATKYFNWGGILGTLLTVPIAKRFGRRAMFALYFTASGAAILATHGLALEPQTRLAMEFLIGLSVFGVFGSFTYYLPELFPTRLRGTGAGFCYNAGRVLAAAGPLAVGAVAARGAVLTALFWVGFLPLLGLLFLPWVVETRGRVLADA